MSKFPDFDLTSLPKTLDFVIPEDYLDVMGHMNVAWYAHLFSEAMGGFLQLYGITEKVLKERMIGVFVLESHARYYAEVLAGQHISIRTRIIARTERRYHLINFMVNHDKGDVVAATFEGVGACVDLKIRKQTPFPPDIGDRIDQLLREHSTLDWHAPLCSPMAP